MLTVAYYFNQIFGSVSVFQNQTEYRPINLGFHNLETEYQATKGVNMQTRVHFGRFSGLHVQMPSLRATMLVSVTYLVFIN